jgi:polysaccharide export outer membrane protein
MKSFRTAIYAIIGIGLAAIAACSTAPASADPQATGVQPAASGSLEGYRLGTGDEIKVTVFGEPDMSGPFTVDGLGMISMSPIGQIEVKNLTLLEVQQKIEAKLKDGWLNEPRVTTEMTKGRPYYILGEVNRPNEYPYTPGLTVMNAIAAAGDFTYRADKKKVMITSSGASVEREIVLTPTTPVHPGDRIRVRERFF